ncbi:spore coat protein U domain-containing protein [Chitinilyticum piscinae]|uniref:Spore coat protein U domain-containing protein n=1 Tax=Chitinilyticum piscinae TaxID=2866724 RepID=A0A8J7FWN1_9NEIS|nr:spore coat U domain-containing protein [Chitinilyticum piscinae]MBE9608165.1 spore coat protein U domain-containing protein [Chitinilyticum piscinae]
MIRLTFWAVLGLWAMTAAAQAASSCSVGSLPDGDMGLYDPQTTTVDLVKQFSMFVRCTEVTTARVTAGPSQTTGSVDNRALKNDNNNDRLRYQLFLDAACTRVFGELEPNAAYTQIASNGGQGRVNFWARVYGNQTEASPGNYRDYVTLTITP